MRKTGNTKQNLWKPQFHHNQILVLRKPKISITHVGNFYPRAEEVKATKVRRKAFKPFLKTSYQLKQNSIPCPSSISKREKIYTYIASRLETSETRNPPTFHRYFISRDVRLAYKAVLRPSDTITQTHMNTKVCWMHSWQCS